MRKRVSVVVPVYNNASYLPQCLESLVNQTIRASLEVILVNDGSTDDSGIICDDYVSKYPDLFRVFHKSNGGSASAREFGWNKAVGDYVIVCDSDDWVEPSMYEDLLKIAIKSNLDVVICDFFYNYLDGKQKEVHLEYGEPDFTDIISYVLRLNSTGSSWNKLVRRQIFLERDLHWAEGINLGEDGLMLLKLLTSGPLKIAKTDKCLYHYRRRIGENTYTNSIDYNRWLQLLYVNTWKQEHLNHEKYEQGLTVGLIDLIFAYLRTNNTDCTFREICNKELTCKQILKAPSPFLKKLLILSAKYLGFRFPRIIVKLLYRFSYR